MNLIRPIRLEDLDALLQMARTAGAGFTSLPPDRDYLRHKIEVSLRSFDREVVKPGHERYLFVLEDTRSGAIGGCCAIEAACGLDEPFYNYHVGLTVHALRELSVYNPIPTLYLSNDYTGCSVLCSLYLSPAARGAGAGRLLSKCRFAFMAQFPQRFAAKVIAEMRGVSDESGRSPFWEGLGRHFFSVDYDRAEHIVGAGNKAFIAELMPKHPIYANLLPTEARIVMGQVHPQTRAALHLLEQEGFRHQGYIDIFDGGPTVEAPLLEIRSIRKSLLLAARPQAESVAAPAPAATVLVSNLKLGEFRCALSDAAPEADQLPLSLSLARALHLAPGDPVRAVPI